MRSRNAAQSWLASSRSRPGFLPGPVQKSAPARARAGLLVFRPEPQLSTTCHPARAVPATIQHLKLSSFTPLKRFGNSSRSSVEIFESTQSIMVHHDSTECRSPGADEARLIHRNPRFSLSFQLCKVLEADLGPRFKFINLEHQF